MREARIALRESAARIVAALIICAVCGLAPAAYAAPPASIAIDFSQHGEGPFDQSFFSDVQFTDGTFVGYVQGDQALIGPVAASVRRGYHGISATFAPAGQGTADYTLAALNSSGRVIADNTVRITQDTGDPETGPWGYATLELGPLPRKAASFRLSNTFVRSSFSHITLIEFGVSQITITR